MGSYHKRIKDKAEKDEEKKPLTEEDIAKGQEVLDEVSQESEEKASDAVIELQKEAEEREEEAKKATEEILNKKRVRGLDTAYMDILSTILYKRAKSVDWPLGYRWRVGKDKDDERKIGLMFKDKNGKVYAEGIKATGEHELDLNAIQVLATRCENTVDKLENRLAWQNNKTKGGIELPKGVEYDEEG